jgi:heme-degrading monooxygenase HmoA
MYARVTHFRILPGKLVPEIQGQKGFRGVLVVHTQTSDPIEVEVLSLWETQEDLDATEKNLSFYHALARVQGFAQGFPSIHVHRVLVSKFA